MNYASMTCGFVLAATATAYASELDCTPQGDLVSPCPPEVTSGRLVANFVAVPETLEFLAKSTAVTHWQAANDSQISLVGGGSPASNISFDPTGLGGHGVLVVNDWSGDNRFLRGSLGGELLNDATVFWLGYFDPGRDGSLGDGSGQYVYTFGRSGSDGSQLDNQVDDGRFEIYGGSGSQTGRDITYLHGADSVWMTRYHGAPTSVGHTAEANGIDLLLPTDGNGYAAGGTTSGEDDLLLFGWQDSSGNAAGYNFVGNIHQLLVYDGLLDDNDTAAIMNYLRSKLQQEPPPPGDDQDLVIRVVEITGTNDASNPAPDIYFPFGDPSLSGQATFVLDPNNNTMNFDITLEDARYVVTQAHMYSDYYKPNGDSVFCWGGRWSQHEFLSGLDYTVHGAHLQEMIDDPGMWTLVVHTEGGHFAIDTDGQLIPYDPSVHETSVSGQFESRGRYNNRVPRLLHNRLLREQNPHSGHFGDPTFDGVYPDSDHFLRENDSPFADADGNQWIEFDEDNGTWIPTVYGAEFGLTVKDIENTEYLFFRYDDQGPYWDYGGPEGAAGGTLIVPVECPADIDGDGEVTVNDLLVVIGAWGDCAVPDDCPADITGLSGSPDGEVDITDLLSVIAAWGACL